MNFIVMFCNTEINFSYYAKIPKDVYVYLSLQIPWRSVQESTVYLFFKIILGHSVNAWNVHFKM
jgi:hypothetical protein